MNHCVNPTARGPGSMILALLPLISGAACGPPALEVCASSGRVCPNGYECAAAQDICIPVKGCGNGVLDEGEFCDDGNVLPGDDCPSDCSTCGNDVVDGLEVCDGEPRTGDTCVTQGFDMGVLQCADSCDGVRTDQCIIFSWRQLPAGESWQIGRIWGSPSGDLYAGGYVGEKEHSAILSRRGTIFHHDGQRWSAHELGGPALVDVWGTDSNELFAVGMHGIIWHFDGRSWSYMESGTRVHLLGVWGTDSNNVYAAGDYVEDQPTLLHYDGSHWQPVQVDTDLNAIYDISGTATGDIFAGSGDGILLHYSPDGTDQWHVLHSEWNVSFIGVWANASNDVYAVGTEGTIVHYDGEAWSQMTSRVDMDVTLTAVWSDGRGRAFAVGENGKVVRYDGNGDGDWELVNSGVEPSLLGIWGNGDGKLLATGFDSTAIEYTGRGWFTARSGTSADLRSVWGTSQQNLFAVGGEGEILHHGDEQDGSWRRMATGTDLKFHGVWGNDAGHVFAVGAVGTILVYDGNSELTWAAVPPIVSQDLKAIWGDSDGLLYVVGDQGTILQYDETRTWKSMSSSSSADLYAVWGIDSKNVYAAGASGTLLHFDGDAEGRWTPLESGVNQQLYDLWGSSEGDVFAVGDGGLILHHDGSENAKWQLTNEGEGLELRAIWGYSPEDIFAAGSSGRVFHYDGERWSTVYFGPSTTILGLWGTKDGNETVFVGRNGLIRQLRRAVM